MITISAANNNDFQDMFNIKIANGFSRGGIYLEGREQRTDGNTDSSSPLIVNIIWLECNSLTIKEMKTGTKI